MATATNYNLVSVTASQVTARDPDIDENGKTYTQADGTVAVTLYGIGCDNTGNTSAVYLKIYDNDLTAPTDSTVPDWIFKIPASTNMSIPFNAVDGFVLAAGLAARCVTTGGTGGTTGPTNKVILTLEYV